MEVNKSKDTRYMLVWPDGEYLYDEQIENNEPTTSMGYTKSDDYTKVDLEFGMNNVEVNGYILVVEVDYWGNTWERDMFRDEALTEGKFRAYGSSKQCRGI